MTSALYHGTVMHSRMAPVRHRFRTRVFSLLADLDSLPDLHRRLRFFSHNRFNLFSLHDRDHGDRPGEGLRAWAERKLAENGWAGPFGKFELLCFPRILGYVFNPLSLFFCHDLAGDLRAVIYEVHNTFGGRHAYVLAVPPGMAGGPVVAQRCGKEFYVSPFLPMDAEYSFRLKPPGEAFSLLIRERRGAGEILRATLSGKRGPLTDRGLLRAFCAYPLMTLKIVAQIHWHALRLLLKGARFHRNPAKAAKARSAASP